MNPKHILWLIAFFSFLGLILHICVLALDDSYVETENRSYNGGCGLFRCEWYYDSDLRDHPCDTLADLIKAACAFGLLALFVMLFTTTIHILLAFRQTAGKVLRNSFLNKAVQYFWAIHLVTVVFLVVCWVLLIIAFDGEHCEERRYRIKLSRHFDLQYGFGFLIVNTVFEAVFAYLCWKHYHVGVFSSGGGRHHGTAPRYYESNPIDHQHFHRRW